MHNKGGSPVCFVEFSDVRFATHALTSLSGTMLPSSAEKESGIRIEYAKNRMGEVSNQQQFHQLPNPQQTYLANAAAAAAAAASLGGHLSVATTSAALGAAEQQMMIEFSSSSCLSPPPNKMGRKESDATMTPDWQVSKFCQFSPTPRSSLQRHLEARKEEALP